MASRKPLYAAAMIIGFILGATTKAQEPELSRAKLGPVQIMTVEPGTRVLLESPPEPAPIPARRPWWTCLNRHGMGCEGHHDEPRTGNICSECVFIFGSSRAFFREPCVPCQRHQGNCDDCVRRYDYRRLGYGGR